MTKAVENLEWMGYSKDSIKGIGMSFSMYSNEQLTDEKESRINVKPLFVGRERQVNHYVTP